MKQTVRSARLIALALSTSLGLAAWPAPQAAAAKPRPEGGPPVPVFGVEASLVLLDVVVRDRRDRLVRDLTAADFELLEDGQPQTIAAFDVIDNELPREGVRATLDSMSHPPLARSHAMQTGTAPGQGEPAVIAFLFDRLSAEARVRAHKAAFAYADQARSQGDLVGVFAIDQTLCTLLPFSKDARQIRAAFDRVAQPAREDPDAPEADAAAGSDPGSPPASPAAAQLPDRPETAAPESELAAAETRARMNQAFDWLQRDQEGFASTNGLLATISGLGTLPGRKTIVFVTEGLRVSANSEAQIESVTAAANRANVSIYAIEAGGLRVASGTENARAELQRAGAERVDFLNRQAMSRPMMVELERSEDLLRLDPRSRLGELAESTGGFLVENTNDAGAAFRRLREDMRFYYVLSYAPTSSERDGAFRRISVKVRRSGLKVFSRSGYLALPAAPAAAARPVRTYEGPALSLLDRAPRLDDFPLWARVLAFPEPERRGRVSVVAGLPLAEVTLVPDDSGRGFQADLSVVARVRDQHGHEVDRLSQHFPVRIPADKLEAARQGEALFFRETDLRPGHYTLELIAYDAQGKKASLRQSRFEVQEVKKGGLALSSVAVLKRVEPLAAHEQARDNPLHCGQGFMYPNLGQPLSKSNTPALGFYLTVYVPEGGAAPAGATIEILKDGRSVARVPAALSAPDSRGRIQHAAAFPLETLAPGEYVLVATVADGAIGISQQTPFAVTR